MKHFKTEIYLNRLKALSLHLQKIAIAEELNGTYTNQSSSNTHNVIECFEWALWELCIVFPRNWKLDENNRPYLLARSELDCLTACSIFFDLNPSQTCAIFAPNYSYHDLHLRALSTNAGYSAVAHQIHWLIVGLVQLHKNNSITNLNSIL